MPKSKRQDRAFRELFENEKVWEIRYKIYEMVCGD